MKEMQGNGQANFLLGYVYYKMLCFIQKRKGIFQYHERENKLKV
jgi:hypothetical protein